MLNKKTKGWLLVLLAIFCLYSSSNCHSCFGCKPTLLEPCSVTFLLLFLLIFAWAIALFKEFHQHGIQRNPKPNLKIKKSKKKKS